MKIKLENLRSLVKEALTETYLGASTVSSLASPAFNKVGPNYEAGVEIPVDAVDLANQIRILIGTDAGYPVGDWGDDALNAAAEAAADALINVNQREKIEENSNRLAEQKNLILEARTVLNEIEADDAAVLSDVLGKVVKLLDSMDMTLDLIYGAVSDSEGAIMGTRIKQKAFGRAVAPSIKPRSGGEG